MANIILLLLQFLITSSYYSCSLILLHSRLSFMFLLSPPSSLIFSLFHFPSPLPFSAVLLLIPRPHSPLFSLTPTSFFRSPSLPPLLLLSLISQNSLCFSYPNVQNLHLTFHYILILVFSCGIVSVLSLPDFDPAIHKETGKVPIVRWILGSQPENDLHGRHAAHPAGEASTVILLLQRPRCSDRTYGRGCALKRIFIKGGDR